MGALLESGLVGNIGLKHLKVIKEDTINKWDKLGFLEGLKGHLKENVAQLYENQASHLINEATSDSSSGSFETVVFPIVRRVFSKLLANEIVSVQAMNLPIGKLFYFVPKIQGYSGGTVTDSLGVVSGDHYAPVGSPGNYPGDPNSGYATGTGSYNSTYQKNLYDLFYEGTEPGMNPAGLFDYSKGRFVTLTASTPTVAWSNGALIASAYTTTTNAEFRKIIVALSGFSTAGIGKLIGPDGQEQDTESFLSNLVLYTDNATAASNLGTSTFTPLLFRVVTQKYGQAMYGPQYTSTQAAFGTSSTGGNGGYYDNVCSQTGFIYLEIDAQVPVCVSCGQSTPDGYSGATLTAASWSGASANTNIKAAWRRYEELEFEDKIGEVSFDLESVTVSVTERKLRAQWSPELAQDVAAFHNIDAEAELTALLSEQVAAEIDREILRDLRKGAAWNLRWDYNGWKRLSSGTTPYTQKDWNQTLITAINQISAQIHKSTLRGGANWIIVSSEISAIFDDLEYFHVSNASPEQDQYNMGIERVGTLSGRYQVYRDPYFPANTVLIGHKGTSLLDTGYIYAPYVPLQLTPTMYNPFNFTPIKGIMTRYAKKMVNNRFYGRITVDGVRTFDLNELR
jgi:hypothetical protein